MKRPSQEPNPRCFRNDLDDRTDPRGWEASLRAACAEWEGTLWTAHHESQSIYCGVCGVLFAVLRGMQGCDVDAARDKLRQIQRRLEEAEGKFSPRRVTFLEGLPGNLALQAAVRLRLRDRRGALALAARVGHILELVLCLEQGECEVLYGRCGYLGAILFLRREFADDTLLEEAAAAVVAQVVESGRRSSRPGWPLYYQWHRKCYFGGCHGIAGILFTLLQFPAELVRIPDAYQHIRDTADALLGQRFPSGNLPSSEGSVRDELVHWCHGPVGLVPLLLLMADVFGEARYRAIATELGELIWTRGLLSTKGPGLCHGIPGNGYVFLALQRASSQEETLWLRRARHFAVVTVQKMRELTRNADTPASLFEGAAGALSFWQDSLAAETDIQQAARFPGYEF